MKCLIIYVFFIFNFINLSLYAAAPVPTTKANTPVTANKVNTATTSAVAKTTSNSAVETKSVPVKKRENAGDEIVDTEIVSIDDQKGILAGLDYPELQVVPRASERLTMESQEEKGRIISPYWPVQLSALSLIYAGIYSSGKYKVDDPSDSQKKENQMATQMAMLTGGLWLGSTFYLTNVLSYTSELQNIKKITGKDKKSQLLRERLSEEALERPARIAYMINTMSVLSSLVCSLYVATQSSQANPGYSNFSIALAFLPWIIDNRITMNWEKHLEYKRKIYAPLSMGTMQYNDSSKKWEPRLTFNWVF